MSIDEIIGKFIELKFDVDINDFSDGTLERWNNMLTEVQSLIEEEKTKARIDELKQLEPPEQYEDYAKIMGSEHCKICGFNAVLFRKVIAERIKALKGDK